jgi:DNA-binding transcriptional ArsR family regulator/DNA-binding PadR family transcriptional regulator
MNANQQTADAGAAGVAAAIGEPARARMLYSLLDGRARTSTELAIMGEVSPSTASAHLARLVERRLLTRTSQGKHRYYRLSGPAVARVLEALSAAAGPSRAFVPSTPAHLRLARTCYDHMAGHVAVVLRDRFEQLRWLRTRAEAQDEYEVTSAGREAFAELGVDVDAVRALRRRFAFACVDWSERRPHIAGALGQALLSLMIARKWFVQDLDSRALRITPSGRRQLRMRFGIDL